MTTEPTATAPGGERSCAAAKEWIEAESRAAAVGWEFRLTADRRRAS